MGNCINENDDFLGDIEDIINNENIEKDDIHIGCNIDVPENVCELCGSTLVEHDTFVPYGDIEVPIRTNECLICG